MSEDTPRESDESLVKSDEADIDQLPRRKPDWWRHTSASSVGIEMAVAIVGCWWVGRWLETNVTHWKPWTSTIGVLVGCGAAALALVRTAKEYKGHLAREAAAEEGTTPDDPGTGTAAGPASVAGETATLDAQIRERLSRYL